MATTISSTPNAGLIKGTAQESADTSNPDDAKDAAAAKAQAKVFSNKEQAAFQNNIKDGRAAEQDRETGLSGKNFGIASLTLADGVAKTGVQTLLQIMSVPTTSEVQPAEVNSKQALADFSSLAPLLGKPQGGVTEPLFQTGPGTLPLLPLGGQVKLVALDASGLLNDAGGGEAPTAKSAKTQESTGASTVSTQADPEIRARVQFVKRLSALMNRTLTAQVSAQTVKTASQILGQKASGLLEPFAAQMPAMKEAIQQAFASMKAQVGTSTSDIEVPKPALALVENAVGKAFGQATEFAKAVKANSAQITQILQKHLDGDTTAISKAPAAMQKLVTGVMSWNSQHGDGSFPGMAASAETSAHETSANDQTDTSVAFGIPSNVMADLQQVYSGLVQPPGTPPCGGFATWLVTPKSEGGLGLIMPAQTPTDAESNLSAISDFATNTAFPKGSGGFATGGLQASAKQLVNDMSGAQPNLAPPPPLSLPPPPQQQGPSPTDDLIASAANLFSSGAFQTMDIDALIMLVMTEGSDEQTSELEDSLNAMEENTYAKEAARKKQEAMQAQQTQMKEQVDNEYYSMKSSGEILSTVTLTQYESFRQISWGDGMCDNTNGSYTGPNAQLQPLPDPLPAWLTTAGATQNSGDQPGSSNYGLSSSQYDYLSNLYNSIKAAGGNLGNSQDFNSWLTNVVGLQPVTDIASALSNEQTAAKFAAGNLPGSQNNAPTTDPAKALAGLYTALGMPADGSIPLFPGLPPITPLNAIEDTAETLAMITAMLKVPSIADDPTKSADLLKAYDTAKGQLSAALATPTTPPGALSLANQVLSPSDQTALQDFLSGSDPDSLAFKMGQVLSEAGSAATDLGMFVSITGENYADFFNGVLNGTSPIKNNSTGQTIPGYPELEGALGFMGNDTLSAQQMGDLGGYKGTFALPSSITYTPTPTTPPGGGSPSGQPSTADLLADYTQAFPGNTYGTTMQSLVSTMANYKNANGQYYDPGSPPLSSDQEAMLQQFASSGVIQLGPTPDQLNQENEQQNESSQNSATFAANAEATGLNHTGSITDMANSVTDAQGDVDSLGDMSTDLQMRIQLEQSQYSQIMEALSNIMKKMSDTSQAIIENMK